MAAPSRDDTRHRNLKLRAKARCFRALLRSDQSCELVRSLATPGRRRALQTGRELDKGKRKAPGSRLQSAASRHLGLWSREPRHNRHRKQRCEPIRAHDTDLSGCGGRGRTSALRRGNRPNCSRRAPPTPRRGAGFAGRTQINRRRKTHVNEEQGEHCECPPTYNIERVTRKLEPISLQEEIERWL